MSRQRRIRQQRSSSAPDTSPGPSAGDRKSVSAEKEAVTARQPGRNEFFPMRVQSETKRQLRLIAEDFGSTPSSVARKFIEEGIKRYFNAA